MEKIKPEKAAEMLRRKGMAVTVEQAALILEFMRKLANTVVAHHLENLCNRRVRENVFIESLKMRENENC